MRVADLMSHPVSTCRPNDSLSRAAQIMWDHDCGIVPVLNAEGIVVGVVTDRDICIAAWSKNRPLSELSVRDCASTRLHTVSEHDSLEVAEARMRGNRVRRLPVVDAAGRLCGILSLGDLARDVHRVATSPNEALSSESIALTLAVISKRRDAIAPARAETRGVTQYSKSAS